MQILSFSCSTRSRLFENYFYLRLLSKILFLIALGCFIRNCGIGNSSRDRFVRTISCRQSPKNQQNCITLASKAILPILLYGCLTIYSEGSRKKKLGLMCWAYFKVQSRLLTLRESKIHRSMKACQLRWNLKILQ